MEVAGKFHVRYLKQYLIDNAMHLCHNTKYLSDWKEQEFCRANRNA